MALTDIIQQLLEKAHKDAEEVAAQTKEQKLLIQAQYKVEEQAITTEINEKKQNGLIRLSRESKASTAKEQRKHTLEAKSKVMKKALEMFYNYLIGLPDADYKKIMTALVNNMNLSGSGIFHAPANRLAITSDIAPNGFNVQVSTELKGGAMIEQGKAHIDIRFKNLIQSEFKTEIEAFFAQKLKLIAV